MTTRLRSWLDSQIRGQRYTIRRLKKEEIELRGKLYSLTAERNKLWEEHDHKIATQARDDSYVAPPLDLEMRLYEEQRSEAEFTTAYMESGRVENQAADIAKNVRYIEQRTRLEVEMEIVQAQLTQTKELQQTAEIVLKTRLGERESLEQAERSTRSSSEQPTAAKGQIQQIYSTLLFL